MWHGSGTPPIYGSLGVVAEAVSQTSFWGGHGAWAIARRAVDLLGMLHPNGERSVAAFGA